MDDTNNNPQQASTPNAEPQQYEPMAVDPRFLLHETASTNGATPPMRPQKLLGTPAQHPDEERGA